MIGIIVKLLLAAIIFGIIISLFILQINKASTASDAANNALDTAFFTQDCLHGGVTNYNCITPDEDRITSSVSTDPLANYRWDGCVNDYPYLIDYGGCEPKSEIEGTDNVAYCCTDIEPQTCELDGFRICFEALSAGDTDITPCGTVTPNDFYHDDQCMVDCSEKIEITTDCNEGSCDCGTSFHLKNNNCNVDNTCICESDYETVCSYYNPSSEYSGYDYTKVMAEECEKHRSCCGEDNDRTCKLDCPDEYPNPILRPANVEPEDWNCGPLNGGEPVYEICCQK